MTTTHTTIKQIETLLANTGALVFEGHDESVVAAVSIECDESDLDDVGNTADASAIWSILSDAGIDVRDNSTSGRVGNGRYIISYTVHA